MFAYVARQPIYTAARELYAYEILFRDGKSNGFPDISPDEATSRILTSTHLSLGLEEVTGEHYAFINFHQDTLMHRFPTSLDPSRTIIEVVETVEVTPQLIQACKHLRGLGYQIALDDYDTSERWTPFLPFTSIIKFDIRETPHEKIAQLVPELKAQGIRLVAEKVETYAEFEQFRSMGFDYFQGYFLARPELIKHRKLNSNQLTMIQLLTESAAVHMSLERINNIIERDPSLTFQLLRFINNPLVNKRNNITSLRHALNYMGELEIKKFVALLALANISQDSPDDLMNMSLVRAKFCEQLCESDDRSDIDNNAGFLLGLLSLLDAMMEQPMEELVSKIPLNEAVQQALCKKPGWLRHCLQLAEYFEQGHWTGVKAFSVKYNTEQRHLHHCFNTAINWASKIQLSCHR